MTAESFREGEDRLPCATFLARLAREIGALEQVTLGVETALDEFDPVVASALPVPSATLQELDRVRQTLGSLATLLDAISGDVPADCDLNVERLLRRLPLKSLADRLEFDMAPLGGRDQRADPEIFHDCGHPD